MKPLELDEIVAVIGARPLGPVGRHTVQGVSTDSRQVKAGELFFALRGDRFDGHRFVEAAIDRGAMAAVVSHPELVPGDLHQMGLLLLVDDTTAALGRLAAYHRMQVRAAVVGVTGSNGKTTTKEMIHTILSGRMRGRAAPKSFNNAVGVPLTLLSVEPDDDFVVVEIGSNAPGEIAQLAAVAAPDVGVITNISETHLERLIDLEGVAKEKASLIDRIREGGCAVTNGESDLLGGQVRRRIRPGDRWITFGRREGVDLRVTEVESGADHVGFRINGDLRVTLPTPGPHNAMNAVAAMAAAEDLGIDMAEGAERLARFQPPAMRLEVHRWGGVTFINDAYNANPASMAAALDVLRGWPNASRRVLVVGQMRELGAASLSRHQDLGRRVAEANIQVVLAVGEMADAVVMTAQRADHRIEARTATDVPGAAALLREIIRSGDVVMIKGSRAVGLEALADAVRTIAEKIPGPGS